MPDTITLEGQGGASFEFVLPLSEPYAEQVRKGKLKPVDEESSKALADSGVFAEPVEAPAGSETDEGTEAPSGPPPKVGKGSGKAAWEAYAKSVGIDTTGKSRAELIKAVEAAPEPEGD